MTIRNALASVAVKDLGAAVKWYETLLGRPADARPLPQLAEWRFDHGGWLQIYEGEPPRAGNGSVTLAVDNIDEHIEALRERGVEAGPVTVHAAVKTLMLRDPDGNHIAFAEATDSSAER